MVCNERAEYLVETYADMILRLSYSYLKNREDARDICQNVLLKLLTDDRQFQNREHEKAFVLRVAINECKDLLKSPWRTRTCDIEACGELVSPQDPEGEVLEAVNALPEKYRVVIYLHYYEGYRAEEIAKLIGVSTNTVYTRLARGREKLKWILGGEAYGQPV